MIVRIIELVRRYRTIRLSLLATVLDCSVDEILYAVDGLENNSIMRVRGSSLVSNEAIAESDISVRMHSRFAEKNAIGKLAASLIKDGESLLIEAGSTLSLFANHLKEKKNLSIATTSPLIAESLVRHSRTCSVELIGGRLEAHTTALHGEETQARIRDLKVDWTILSPTSMCIQKGACYFHKVDAETSLLMQRSAQKTMMLSDSSKLGVPSRYTAQTMQGVDVFITDNNGELGFAEVDHHLRKARVFHAISEDADSEDFILLNS
ncbi:MULTISPECIES: DeoR/GlpR family DNA-binding transcription regulator [unclassified Pseudovibrio]|uniref:DeoR/GlpR family DNA-binding transcription regulator n=1 Tax=unclassified Pseudovibrio TaxID=2627060 RepID=UPI00070EC1D1|nr:MULTISPECIES: DeoR/GlpR family DNA-binding transcription regulator [unclassified Pseudovibrio]KZL03141.1 HTH-type transcriptional repressor GlcR [Pseudovibrio sp. W74]KZL04841.1 HTH-type transcriptional repressor GlcR [Pseudovibrio sp. Ad14]